MALAKEIQEKIAEFSIKNQQDNIASYLTEELKNKRATAKDILDYARLYIWPDKPGKPHVISADTINLLGLAVSKTDPTEDEFYLLAAERGSAWGNVNCAINRISNAATALPFAKKALELSKDKLSSEYANFYLARCYAALGSEALAWKHYSLVTYKDLSKQVIAGRAQVLRDSIRKKLNMPRTNEQPTVKLSSALSKKWKKEAAWFDSIDEEQINDATATDEITGLEQAMEKLGVDNNEHYFPAYRQRMRRYKAEKRFFDPKRSKKTDKIYETTHHILTHRYKEIGSEVPSINLTGISSRLLISAERAYQDAVIELSEKNAPELGIPVHRRNPWSINGYSGENLYGPAERYQVDATIVKAEHRANPKPQRLGDSFLVDHGNYTNSIYLFLSGLSNNENEKEKKLASFIIRYGKKHQGVTLEELKTICAASEEDDVKKFNQICFLLMEKEQSQWHSATSKVYHSGMMVAQARCLIMIEAGFISFKEAFKNDAFLGVYSQVGILNNPDKVDAACMRIDKLYMAYLQHKNASEYFTFLKKYINDTRPRTCVLTREQAHQDLKQVYGGDSDTDDQGYESDLSMSL